MMANGNYICGITFDIYVNDVPYVDRNFQYVHVANSNFKYVYIGKSNFQYKYRLSHTKLVISAAGHQ